jgi:hypothetical protein
LDLQLQAAFSPLTTTTFRSQPRRNLKIVCSQRPRIKTCSSQRVRKRSKTILRRLFIQFQPQGRTSSIYLILLVRVQIRLRKSSAFLSRSNQTVTSKTKLPKNLNKMLLNTNTNIQKFHHSHRKNLSMLLTRSRRKLRRRLRRSLRKRWHLPPRWRLAPAARKLNSPIIISSEATRTNPKIAYSQDQRTFSEMREVARSLEETNQRLNPKAKKKMTHRTRFSLLLPLLSLNFSSRKQQRAVPMQTVPTQYSTQAAALSSAKEHPQVEGYSEPICRTLSSSSSLQTRTKMSKEGRKMTGLLRLKTTPILPNLQVTTNTQKTRSFSRRRQPS